MLTVALLGFALGFVGSMPLAGPVSVLVLRRGLRGAHRSGLALAAGAALAEGTYAFLAYWGLGALLGRHPALGVVSRGAAAAILLALGLYFLLARTKTVHDPAPERQHERGSFAAGLAITALNPTLVATWSAVVTVLHASGRVTAGPRHALPFALAVAAGIVGWFWSMLQLLRRWQRLVPPAAIDATLRLVGVGLLAGGGWFAWRTAEALLGNRPPGA